jgi:hypothetical protein
MRSARQCQRLHHLRFRLGYHPVVEAEALRFGTLAHKALEAWWFNRTADRFLVALNTIRGAEADPYDKAKAEAMLIGYDERWRDEPYEVMGVEAGFESALVNPDTGRPSTTWFLAGTIDAIAKDTRDGRTLIVEHKTSAEDISPGSAYWKRLRMDQQISTYYEGATSLGYDISGCLYDVLGKPALRPHKATPAESRKYKADGTLYANQRDTDETPDAYRDRIVADIAENPAKYFQRAEVVRLESEMQEALRDTWQLAKQLREAELANSFPRNPGACVSYGRTCEFFPVCAGEASLDDSNLFRREQSVEPPEAIKETP